MDFRYLDLRAVSPLFASIDVSKGECADRSALLRSQLSKALGRYLDFEHLDSNISNISNISNRVGNLL